MAVGRHLEVCRAVVSQAEKADAFAALHRGDGAFIIPNPWDTSSARVLEALGFAALATTSSGFAYSLGKLDGGVSFEQTLEHCRELSAATEIPVSADLENGHGDGPEAAAMAITLVARAGVVGGSIEDYSGSSVYELELAVERISAAVEAARQLPFPFTLTARGNAGRDVRMRKRFAWTLGGLATAGLTPLDNITNTRAIDYVITRGRVFRSEKFC